jgi:hypothetical protein
MRRLPSIVRARATAARTAASATVGGSGRLRPAAMYGSSHRSVAMPRAASATPISLMNACRIPAPAPCASTYSHRAPSG